MVRMALAVCFVGVSVASATPPASPVMFDGLGLAGFEGSGSIAAELERIEATAERERLGRMPALAVAMPRPADPAAPPVPLTAELRHRFDRFDVAAGLLADSAVVAEGPARWVGRVGVSNDRANGRESLELRTTIGNNAEWGLVGVEVGPRVERRLGKGTTIFMDGKAEAQVMRSAETGWWSFPGTATEGGMVGVTARTGLAR
ncbi:MAG: hypothetical protein ACKOC8_08180 [Pirellulales bacterium]